MVYLDSVFYDEKGKEIYIPKGVPVKERQAGEVLSKLFETTATKRPQTKEIRPVKKVNPRQLSEQTTKVANNKKTYKAAVENFLKDMEEYERTGKDIKKEREGLIMYRNFKILFGK